MNYQLSLDLIPLSKWNDYFEFPTVSAMRQWIFRDTDGFNNVVRLIGGKKYIKVSDFKQWVEDTNNK